MTTSFTNHARTFLVVILWMLLASAAFGQTWTPRNNVPLTNGIDAVVSFTINNKIYFAGGAGSKFLFVYDPATNSWAQKADIPGVTTYRAFGTGFAINDKGYMTLGADAGGIYPNDLWEYNPATDSWSQKADFPGQARTTVSSFVLNGRAYVLGGVTADNFYSNEVWEYNPATDAWVSKATLPNTGASFPFAFSIGSKGYYMGGEVNSLETTDLYEFNPTSNIWTPRASFPGAARQAGVSFVLNGMAYCGLGMAAYDTMFGDFFRYDPAANTWAAQGDFDGGERAWATAAVVNNKAYVGSGWDFNTFFKDWWELSVTTGILNQHNTRTDLVVFPNPAKGSLKLDLKATEGKIHIYDMTGRLVSTQSLNALQMADVRELPAGNYFLRVDTGEDIMQATFCKE